MFRRQRWLGLAACGIAYLSFLEAAFATKPQSEFTVSDHVPWSDGTVEAIDLQHGHG